MSQREGQVPSAPAMSQRPRQGSGPARSPRPAGPVRDHGRPRAAAAPAGPPAGLGLTGRGALAGMFALSLIGLLLSHGLGWGPLGGGAFVIGCGLAAGRTVPRDLLPVAVSAPALFFAAVICAQALTSPGSLLHSITAGTLIALGNMALWLIAGTALCLVITFARGLPDNVRELGKDLRRYRASTTPGRRPGQAA